MLANFLNNVGAAFNLTVMGLVLIAIGSKSDDSSAQQGIVASAGMAGAVSGQLIMGFLGDCLGRLRALGLTTILILIGSFLSAFLPRGDDLLFTLAICRFVTGFGVGGIYPLTAVASAEEKGNKGVASTLLVFSGQGWGQLLAPLTVYLLGISKVDNETIWRTTLALAALPSIVSLLLMFREMRKRMKDVESDAINSILRVAGDHPANVALRMEQDRFEAQDPLGNGIIQPSFLQTFCNWKNMKKLIGTGGTWFIFDVTFYANVVFAPIVLGRVFGQDSNNGIGDTAGPTCIALLIGLPGYYIAVAIVQRTGLKRMQLYGFGALAVLYGILAATVEVLPPGVLFTIYALTFLVSNLGPNSTTFCLPSKTFPRASRSTFNGISAALGKLGAVVGTLMFPPILESSGIAGALGFSSFVALSGAILTFFMVESEFIPFRRVGSLVEMAAPPFQNTSLELPRTVSSPKRTSFSSHTNVGYLSQTDNPFAIGQNSYQKVNSETGALDRQ